MRPPETITCVDCGGTASLISFLPEDGDELEPGTVVSYRCEDCLERFDVVMDLEEGEDGEPV